jgi:hypothetical protein
MAAQEGLGDQVPDLVRILARYQDRFETDFKIPEGWEKVVESRYATDLQPKNADKQKIGIKISIDLLIKEFSQDVESVEEYSSIHLAKAVQKGFSIPTDQPPPPFLVKEAHFEVWVTPPQGKGRILHLFRKISPELVVLCQVVSLEENDSLLTKYRNDIESIVNETRITARQSRQ